MSLAVYQSLVLEKHARQIVLAVKDRLIERGEKVTGELEGSFKIEATETGIIIYVRDYIYFLEYGKSPAQAQSEGFESVRAGLLEWIVNKGIPVPAGMQFGTLAYLMARKQLKEGTVTFRKTHGASSGLFDGIIDSTLIAELSGDLGDAVLKHVESLIIKEFKKTFV